MTMKQKILLGTGTALVILLVFLPPTHVSDTSDNTSIIFRCQDVGYQPIFTTRLNNIHLPLLVIQLVVMGVITFGLFLLSGRTEKSAARQVHKLSHQCKKLQREIAQYTNQIENLQQQNDELSETIQKLQQKYSHLNEIEKDLQGIRDQIKDYFVQKNASRTTPLEEAPEIKTDSEETSETTASKKKSAQKSAGPAEGKFDVMRERMVNEIVNMNEFIKKRNL